MLKDIGIDDEVDGSQMDEAEEDHDGATVAHEP